MDFQSDGDDSEIEETDIDEDERDIQGAFHSDCVSGWTEDDDGVEEEEKPHGIFFYSSFFSVRAFTAVEKNNVYSFCVAFQNLLTRKFYGPLKLENLKWSRSC